MELFVSVDQRGNWSAMKSNLWPTERIDDAHCCSGTDSAAWYRDHRLQSDWLYGGTSKTAGNYLIK